MTAPVKLLDCPGCGGEAFHTSDYGPDIYGCRDCSMQAHERDHWNDRAKGPAEVRVLELQLELNRLRNFIHREGYEMSQHGWVKSTMRKAQ